MAARRGLDTVIREYMTRRPASLTMKQLYEFASDPCEKTSFNFLKQELPIRMASCLHLIETLPEGLRAKNSIMEVHDWYKSSFSDLEEFVHKEENSDSFEKFYDTLKIIRMRHARVVESMAKGVHQLRREKQITEDMDEQITRNLDHFFQCRISQWLLMKQHMLLFDSMSSAHIPENPEPKSCIERDCDVVRVVKDAYERIKNLTLDKYMVAPELEIVTCNSIEKTQPIDLVYVPSHLFYMVCELMKNAMRATVEHNGEDSDHLPPVKVVVVRGREKVSVKISDQGGGIPDSKVNKILFRYASSTVKDGPSPLAGYGVGLPMARVYAQYLSGQLYLSSIEGYGTDAIIGMQAMSEKAFERLPLQFKPNVNPCNDNC